MTDRNSEHGMFNRLQNYNDSQERLKWTGSFEDYIDMVVKNPDISRSSFKTVYDAITSRPDFFTTGKNALFGADETIEHFTNVLKAGSEGLEIGKRIILLLGPPGSGKSTLVNGTKRAIEAYSKTDEGAIYAIDDCPMHEDPMHLIPEDMRASLEDEYGVHIEGNLCPHCEEKYGGGDFDSEKLKGIQVSRIFLSEKDRTGVGSFKPSDPKSQDITELVGSVDYSKIGEFGSGSDPRAYRFDGELNVANRGVMEFVEMLKSDEKFLYALLDLVQDRVIKAPRFAPISADEVIIAHTNFAEYERYVHDQKNEALRDRIIVVYDPYTLEVSQERKIHEKLIAQSERVQKSGVHINPLSLDTAATFAVLTRLASSPKYSKVQKLRVYDGDDSGNLTWRDAIEMKKESPTEGMTGISPRYIIDSLSMALTKQGRDKNCLTPIDTYRALRDSLKSHPHTRDMEPKLKEAILADLEIAKQLFDEQAKQEVQKAFVFAYEDTAQSLANNYISNVDAYVNKKKLEDPYSDKELEPDEKLMRSIEEKAQITENGKKEFRTELVLHAFSRLHKGELFDYKSHTVLKKAIEGKLFGDMKDLIKVTTSAVVPNEKQQKRIQDVEQTLIEERGYCEHCAGELLRYVGTLLNKE